MLFKTILNIIQFSNFNFINEFCFLSRVIFIIFKILVSIFYSKHNKNNITNVYTTSLAMSDFFSLLMGRYTVLQLLLYIILVILFIINLI